MASTINATAHGLSAGDPFQFANIVPDDTGVNDTTVYYVLASNLSADTFEFSTSVGGGAVTLDYAIESADIVEPDAYTPEDDGPTSPPETPAAPSAPTVSSVVVDVTEGASATGTGTVALTISGLQSAVGRTRYIETQVTRAISGTTPDWTKATSVITAPGVDDIALPALGDADYQVRSREADVYGNISDWSTIVSHTSLTGADGRALTNANAKVTIDAVGITIEDGALILKDEWGSTVMVAGGFSGSWFSFIRLGLYNGNFSDAPVATNIATGRTAALPYWTITKDVGSPTVDVDSSNRAVVNFAALNDEVSFQSDRVPVAPHGNYTVQLVAAAAVTTAVGVEVLILYWRPDGTYIGSVVTTGFTELDPTMRAYYTVAEAAHEEAAYAAVKVTVTDTDHVATCKAIISSVGLLPMADARWDYASGDGVVEVGSLTAKEAVVTGDLVAADVYLESIAQSTAADNTFEGAIITAGNITVGDPTGSNTSGISLAAGGSIEIVKEASTPFIDFKNDSADDFDARIVLTGDDVLSVQGAALDVRRLQHQAASIISPTALAANTNDWNPTGLGTAYLIRATSDATPRNLTGITAQADGTVLYLHNANAATTITLVHDATSTGANRFLCKGAANFALTAKTTVMLVYDSTADRWLVIG